MCPLPAPVPLGETMPENQCSGREEFLSRDVERTDHIVQDRCIHLDRRFLKIIEYFDRGITVRAALDFKFPPSLGTTQRTRRGEWEMGGWGRII